MGFRNNFGTAGLGRRQRLEQCRPGRQCVRGRLAAPRRSMEGILCDEWFTTASKLSATAASSDASSAAAVALLM